MNFSEDFIIVQGIVIKVHEQIGNFQDIKHRGGILLFNFKIELH